MNEKVSEVTWPTVTVSHWIVARLKKKKLDTAADVDVNDKKVNNIMRGSG